MRSFPSFVAALLSGWLMLGLSGCDDKTTPEEPVPVPPVTMKDMDGTTYQTVKIGDLTWTKTNLSVSRYRNGDLIPEIKDPAQWTTATTGAWCHYANDAGNGAVYGKLYNWYAVADPRGLAPQGWHIPSDTEFKALITALGGENGAGGNLKEAGTLHWLNPNTGATNSSGFTALPGGYRCSCSSGAFYNLGNQSLWWSSASNSPTTAWNMELSYNNVNALLSGNDKHKGYTIRCVMD